MPLDRGFELRWVEDWSAERTAILARLKEGTPADRSAGDALAWVSVKEGSVRISVSSVAGRIVNGACFAGWEMGRLPPRRHLL